MGQFHAIEQLLIPRVVVQFSQARQHGDVRSQDVVHIGGCLQPGEGQLMIANSNCSQRDGYRHAIALIR